MRTRSIYAFARRWAHKSGLPWEKIPGLIAAFDDVRFQGALVALNEHAITTPQWLEMGLWLDDVSEGPFMLCGSPIEELFLAYCEIERDWLGPAVWWSRDFSITWPCGLELYQQREIGSFRVDFTIEKGAGGPVAVELDGHDFHERTKQQAARDKSRDRALQEAGWKVLRFTGSEVWRAPDDCVEQALRIARGS